MMMSLSRSVFASTLLAAAKALVQVGNGLGRRNGIAGWDLTLIVSECAVDPSCSRRSDKKMGKVSPGDNSGARTLSRH